MIKSIISMLKKLKGEQEINNNKVVCGCFNVTEQDIKNAINNGAKSYQEVQNITKVGTGCGGCLVSSEELVNELLIRKKIDENQIVCGCFKVTAGDIVAAIKNGAKSFEDVQAVTKVGTGCGRCIQGNKALVDYLLKK
jgi:NAD(P)H-nitrite reductase large subunit